MNTIKNAAARVGIVSTVVGAALFTGLVLAGSASATPADPVDTAFGDMLDKIQSYGLLIVGLVVASTVLFLGIKYLRKGVSKA